MSSCIIQEKRIDSNGIIQTIRYQKGRFLGKGGFARCYEFTCLSTGVTYAGKIVPKANLIKPKAKLKLRTEIRIHRKLNHPRIVKFINFFEDEENSYIFLELCPNNSLSELLKRRKRLDEIEVRYYLKQLLEGIIYLHGENIIHRDIKLGNFFLDKKMQLKIGDFGLATQLKNKNERKKTMCGTPNYIAPEILYNNLEGHSFEVDIWSIGVVMYTLIIGKPPFEMEDLQETYKKIKKIDYSFDINDVIISKNAKDMINLIFKRKPEERPNLQELLDHPFIVGDPNNINDKIPTYLSESTLRMAPHISNSSSISYRKKISDKKLISTKYDENINKENNPYINKNPEKDKQLDMPRAPLQPHNMNIRKNEIDIISEYKPPKIPINKINTIYSNDKLLKDKKYTDALPTINQISKSKPLNRRSSSVNALEHSNGTNMTNDKDRYKYTNREIGNVKDDNKHRDIDKNKNKDKDDDRTKENDRKSINPNNNQKRTGLEIIHKCIDLFLQIDTNKQIDITESKLQNLLLSNNDEKKKNFQTKQFWITQYVDYTSKYGFGYLSSYGTTCVNFNDATKIILANDNQNVEYIPRIEKYSQNGLICERYTMNKYDETLKKKITLLGHFRLHLKSQKEKALEKDTTCLDTKLKNIIQIEPYTNTNNKNNSIVSMVFLRKWIKTRHAILFYFTNETIQADFYDFTKILVSQNCQFISFYDKQGNLIVYEQNEAIKNSSIIRRLTYVKDMIKHLIKEKRAGNIITESK